MEKAKKVCLEEENEAEVSGGIVMMEGSSSPLNVELHPLLNPVVLDVLFSHCGLEGLKALRRVSRLYYDKSLKHWLQLGPTVRITSFRQIEEISRILSSTDAEYPGWPHHTKYALASVPLWAGDWSRMEHFWNQAATWMTHLTLTDCTFQDHRTLRDVLFCVHTPVLESLRLSYRLKGRIGSILIRTFMQDQLNLLDTLANESRLRVQDYRSNFQNMVRLGMEVPWSWPHLDEHYRQLELRQREKNNNAEADNKVHLFPKLTSLWIETLHVAGTDVPFCWVELLSQYPNLKTFHLYIKPEDEDYDSERDGLIRALRAIVALREADRARLQLTEFGLICPKTSALVELDPHYTNDLFRRAELPLQSLRVKLLPSSTSGELSNTLGVQSTVPLQRLSLVANSNSTTTEEGLEIPIPGLDCPLMESVMELNIEGNIFADMRFLRSFPNLGKLNLLGISHLEEVMDRGDAWVDGMLLDVLKELKVDNNAIPLNPPGLASFRKICHNLKSLEMMPLSKVGKVCEHWPNLERLSFSITGANMVAMRNDIGKMKDLRHLEIRINSFSTTTETDDDDDAAPGMMMDDLILNGILELKQLKFLSLVLPESSSSASKISEETITALRKAVGTVSISPEGMAKSN